MTGAPVDALDLVVGGAVVLLAVVALTTRGRMAAVVSFLVLGVLLSVLWALAGAPDVALAEAAIGAGVTGVLFVTVVRAGPAEGPAVTRPPRRLPHVLGAVATVTVAGALAAGLAPALQRASRPLGDASAGLAPAVEEVLPRTGVDHGVTAVLLNLRSYDTLLEMAVVLTAVLAVLAVSGGGAAGGGPVPAAAVPALQRSATGVLVPVLVLLAAWLLFAGSSRPGGAFQSGAVVAGVVVLLHLAARPVLPPGHRRSAVVAVVGLAAFVLVAAAGPLLLGAAWLQLDPGWAGVVIVALESLLAASIGASLALVALAVRGEGVDAP